MPDPKASSGLVESPENIPPPQLGPASTGNLITDSFRSAFHIGEVPCARNSLLSGIASGVGIGIIRGISVNPVVAGNWAMGTFALVSTVSWMMCVNKIENEQQVTRKAIQGLPKQLGLKKEESSKE
ncbi:hypothetical protein MIND_00831600 [Mycena indigotica]|uniref:Cytochrome c oxidase assembly protein COX20, mitochondrial n=1 Tax=Mycena indigotica TaxID=2126181 RepID=A0A8H6W4D2_9AGAR|nr:uncharacterized protein MIND_00831600 [Mycena indigotica]KAF7298839.1 hypothetical protein MIND_00831600 [Mycena indigotica]